MLKPESLKAKPADNYEDLKKQFFALKNLCELKIKQCSIYSNKLAEYDRESLIARNEALESEKEMNAQLTEELAKANERVKELEFSLGRLRVEILHACVEGSSSSGGIKKSAAHNLHNQALMIPPYAEQLRKEQE